MKFDRDDRSTYMNCDNCLHTELTPLLKLLTLQLFVPAILAALQLIGSLFSPTNDTIEFVPLDGYDINTIPTCEVSQSISEKK
ncbi:hypothetical protein TNCV_3825301 [Trichonephila clavipes]|nr:hypothetical protein TNCV_3825301 [Trichonephila clavipes]